MGSFDFQVNGGLKGKFDLATGDDYVEQDVAAVLEDVKRQKDYEAYYGRQKESGMRKMATIPDIVALQILVNHNLDIHDPNFGQDPSNAKKLRTILLMEYPHLVINK